jgi:SRSO17 transposase
VWTQEDRAVAARLSIDLDHWQREFDDLMSRIGNRFVRVEPRRRVARFVRGLLAGLPRTNCWTLAEHAGDAGPQGMQWLLSAAAWDDEGVVRDLRDYVVAHLADPGAVLVVDETGDVKKGTATVGVQRQYTGTAGRIENSQVAVYLAYASSKIQGGHGYAFIDRALYLPRSWTDHPQRCAAAGVPDEVGFATKPALAARMIGAALEAGTPAAWVAGDEVYGNDPKLRAAIAGHGLGYVLAVAKDHQITTGIGARKAIELAVRLPRHAWQRLSAGAGAKGQRWYDWALIDTNDTAVKTSVEGIRRGTPGAAATGAHWLLIRRSISDDEFAFYRAHAPQPVPLAELVRVAGSRWKVEEGFAGGKELAALDEHQVRTWTSWHRWTALALLAHAFLSILAATQPAPSEPAIQDQPIPLTRNEIRRLITGLLAQPLPARFQLHWSRWRQLHQARARTAHYRRQATRPT